MTFRYQLPAYSPIALHGLLTRPETPERVEHRLRDAYEATAALAVDSGTSALRLALRAACGASAGPVAMPAYGCYDLATAAVGAGVRVVLYDVDPRTLGPDTASLASAVERGVAAIVVAYLYGVPVDLAPVRALAERSGALVIEDAAQGVGGAWKGRPLGAWGSLSVLSFGRGKGRTAGGGGALLAFDQAGGAALASVRPLVRTGGTGVRDAFGLAVQWALGRPSVYRIPASLPFLGLGETVYRAPSAPAGFSLVARRMVRHALRASPAEEEQRRRNAERLTRVLPESDGLQPVEVPAEGVAGYLRLPLVAGTAAARERAGAARALGIMPGYPLPLSALPQLQAALDGAAPAMSPGAEALAGGLVTLPTHSRLAEADLTRLEAWIRAS